MSVRLVLALAALTLALLVAVAVRGTLFSSMQARRMKFRVRFHMKPGPGFASIGELWLRWGRLAALHHGGRARPSMTLWMRLLSPATQYATRLGRAQWFKRVYARHEDHELIFAPPRVGKTGLLGDQVADWPGAAVVHESRLDLLRGTTGYRARTGPVEVFNPEGLGRIGSTFRWAMLAGCGRGEEALYRATDLVMALDDAGENEWWMRKARKALAAGMHCGDLIGASLDDVHAWASDPAASARSPLVQEAARHPGVSRRLLFALSELDRPSKAADSVRMFMSEAMTWMDIPSLHDAVAGPGAAPFDVPAWLEARGTIYLVSPGGEEAPSAPVMRCLASYLHRQAKMHAQLLPAERLDPRLGFFLDEYHRCPVPLDSWVGDSAGAGIKVVTVIHSTGQLEAKLGRAGLRTVWGSCGTKVFLTGISEVDTLRDISALSGSLPGDAGDGKQDHVAPVEVIRCLPEWRALVLRLNLTPAIVKVRPFWRRWPARLGRVPAMPPLAPVAAPPAVESTADLTEELAALTEGTVVAGGRATADGLPVAMFEAEAADDLRAANGDSA